ncbi:MAG TPA: cytochrome c biogenesis protein ResB [Candidatus Azosocius sp. HAIN]
MKKKINIIIEKLSSTKLFCLLIIYLIFLIIIGTISQKEMGLIYSQKKYFSSYIILIENIIPIPGGFTIFILISINLLLKIYVNGLKNNISFIFIHIGALILIISGIFSNINNKEGNILLYENEKTNQYININKFNLLFYNKKKYIIIKNEKIYNNKLPFLIEKKKNLKNFFINKKKIKKKYILLKIILNNKIKNIFLNIISTQQINIFFENTSFSKNIKYKNKKYNITIENKKYKIPFYINLHKFKKKNYPGTNISNKFESIITIKTNKKIINTKIKMNKPIKYKKYIFYQTAFIEKENKNATILTITKNNISFIFYISSILICIGLIINLTKKDKKNYV